MDDTSFVSQQIFWRLLDLEHKRMDRSHGHFLLLLVEAPGLLAPHARVSRKLISTVCRATRETDIKGWFTENSTCGIIFTEVAGDRPDAIKGLLCRKISGALSKILSRDEMGQVRLSCFLLPEDGNNENSQDRWNQLSERPADLRRSVAAATKRFIDIAGSLVAIIALAPLLAAIAIAIKCTSRGPVLFRQKRHGLCGQPFTFLKFRSMYESSDPHIHQEYMKRLIAGETAGAGSQEGRALYKMTNDPRVTSLGRVLRRSSLDELPQFFNVLMGDMSLVGPRPPLPYEVTNYARWHRRRLRETKPGITGLWQVHGRSRTSFNEMVRLDLMYGRNWSLWLDLKILFLTPWAVLTGTGAY